MGELLVERGWQRRSKRKHRDASDSNEAVGQENLENVELISEISSSVPPHGKATTISLSGVFSYPHLRNVRQLPKSLFLVIFYSS